MVNKRKVVGKEMIFYFTYNLEIIYSLYSIDFCWYHNFLESEPGPIKIQVRIFISSRVVTLSIYENDCEGTCKIMVSLILTFKSWNKEEAYWTQKLGHL